MTKNQNPVAFNALTMSGYQLKECADTLRTLFDLLAREATSEDIKAYVEQARDHLSKTWSA
jgi:hypothetical protein